MKQITVTTPAMAIWSGTRPRLVFTGGVWNDWAGEHFCAHGEKLRWSCDDCAEYFDKHPNDIPPAEKL